MYHVIKSYKVLIKGRSCGMNSFEHEYSDNHVAINMQDMKNVNRRAHMDAYFQSQEKGNIGNFQRREWIPQNRAAHNLARIPSRSDSTARKLAET